MIKLIKILGIIFSLQALLLQSVLAQPVTLSTPTTDIVTSNQSITMTAGFSSSGPFHAYISGMINVPLASTPSQDQNYIRTRVYKIPSQTVLSNPTVREMSESVQYFDGLGRALQTVQTKSSPNGYDILQAAAYDAYGREAITYQPYAEDSGNGTYRSAALSRQGQFYGISGWDNAVAKTAFPYSKTIFESSPLNRALEQGAPGEVWQPAAQRNNTTGRTKLTSYGANTSNTNNSTDGYAVRLWIATPVSGATYKMTLSSPGLYNPGELSLTITKDENWLSTKAGTVEEYTDKEGHIVLKRLFNLKNNVIEILNTYYVYDDRGNLSFVLPPASNPDAATITSTVLNVLCYQYRYDARNRLIEKKIPGKGWDYLVYNQSDRPVLSQDSVQRIGGKWTFTKYDVQGREIMTGLYTSASSRTALQTTLNAETIYWETPTTTGVGYTTAAFPQSIGSYLNIQYYDNYSFPGASSYLYTASKKTTGLVTGSLTYVLGSTNGLLSVNYYDDEGRVSKSYKQHFQSGAINVNNYDEISNTYSFESQLTASTRIHRNAVSGNTTITNRYEYDHVGRRLTAYENINSGGEVMLAESRYNEIGQLKDKSQGDRMQFTSYLYNERGWLTEKKAPLFAMQLKYNEGTFPRFNGDISNQLWGTPSSLTNNFTYSYDALSRLLAGDTGTGTYEKDITYDLMGNILTLNRNGTGVQNYVYTPTVSGNRLNSVNGGVTRTYGYDGNGNATSDGTNTLTYNILNLPATVSGGSSITYTYDATGRKLRRVSGGVTTDYIDGIQYTAGTIDFIQTEEGIARKNGANYSYEYTLTDHLGNNRLTFDRYNGAAREIQHDNYYPFGKTYGSYTYGTRNNYLYNGKELQSGLEQYDYGARFYDAVVARWKVIDPMSENHTGVTPYNYVLNNPLMYADEFGLDTTKVIKLKEVVITPQTMQTGFVNVLVPGRPFNWLELDYAKKQQEAAIGTRNTLIFAGENIALSLIPVGRVLKWGKLGAALLFGERLLPEVSAIGAQKILKIMNKTHAWDKIATSWDEAASIISKTMKEGSVMPYGTTGLSSKVIQHNGEIVQVVYTQVAGKTVVSNAWVITDPAYKWRALTTLK